MINKMTNMRQYVSCGFSRDGESYIGLPTYFNGKIYNLRFTMNALNRAP